MTAVVAVSALVLAAFGLFGWWRASGRVAALEGRVGRLEREVRDDLVPTLDLTRRESEQAYVAARMAKHAVGIETGAKADCHSDYVPSDEARKLQTEKLVTLRVP